MPVLNVRWSKSIFLQPGYTLCERSLQRAGPFRAPLGKDTLQIFFYLFIITLYSAIFIRYRIHLNRFTCNLFPFPGNGTFEFDIDSVNTFLAENSIEPLKREYRVEFRIEGTILVEAENEDEAQDIVNELDVTHWSAEVEHFEAESTNVEATF